jgi:hypothetical protein
MAWVMLTAESLRLTKICIRLDVCLYVSKKRRHNLVHDEKDDFRGAV